MSQDAADCLLILGSLAAAFFLLFLLMSDARGWCKFKHNWPKWSGPIEAETAILWFEPSQAIIQERTCLRCNEHRWKRY